MGRPDWIVRKAGGYETERLESYDLTPERWREVSEWDEGFIATSMDPDDLSIYTLVIEDGDGTLRVVTVAEDYGDLYEGPSVEEAMREHEWHAEQIVARLDAMLGHEGHDALQDGAL